MMSSDRLWYIKGGSRGYPLSFFLTSVSPSLMRLCKLLVILCALSVLACSQEAPKSSISFDGQTMGTTYRVSFPAGAANPSALKAEADELLIAINQSLSTYIDSSSISHINVSQDVTQQHPINKHFQIVMASSQTINTATKGAFNPAVGPLVAAWGFGPEKTQEIPGDKIDSLLALIDFSAFQSKKQGMALVKKIAGAQLDFSAIAKGYGVDAVGQLLEAKGIQDYLVEIGGEVRSKGQHPAGRNWRVGIDKPLEELAESREIQVVIELDNQSMATSGNYRNFYIKDGKKYVHTINPFTGYPEVSDLLSVSVIAKDCMTADGYATAFMVMGKEKAMEMVKATPELEALFITSDDNGNYVETKTPGFPDAFSPQ